jgi:ADP-heptose:LPS heptosyltransferase
VRVHPLFPGVRRIVVLRGGGIGDVLFAVPALSALHAAYPDATITVLTSASGRVLDGRLPFPVCVVEMPWVAAIHEAAGAQRDDGFLTALRGQRFDLAVQLHGGGRNSNPFLLGLGAAHTVGMRTPDAPALERSIDYVYYQHEVMRYLEVAALAGAAPVALEPELRVLPGDVEAADAALVELPALSGNPESAAGAASPLVVMHPGATDPRRRWPADRFGQVAAALAGDGARVIVIGDARERELGGAVRAAAASDRVIDLVGALGLPALIGLLARAELFVGNDSGPRHVAQAVGTPTASIYWYGNVINASPLSRGEHRLRMSVRTRCPVCGADQSNVGWTSEFCGHSVSFVAAVRVDDVLADARELLSARRG